MNELSWSEWETVIEDGPLRVRAGFCRPATELVAGGPLQLKFFAEASQPILLAVAADRVRLRPDFFHFSATLDGVEIHDPFPSSTTYLGGPGGTIQIRPDASWNQWLIVNQYLRLERALEVLGVESAVGRLELRGGRPLPLTSKAADAFRRDGVPQIDVTMTIPIRRDDTRLAALVNELIERVRQGPPEQREEPLSLVLALRAPMAVELWKTLVDHSDPTVAERVHQALKLANQT